MEPAHGFAAAFIVRITLEHISGEVLGTRVVHCVQADGLRAVVLRDVHRAAQANLQPGKGANYSLLKQYDCTVSANPLPR